MSTRYDSKDGVAARDDGRMLFVVLNGSGKHDDLLENARNSTSIFP